ncbi:hypothetical protein DUI87_18141 [Hirundo rustica rustica]|uniref:Uncharacterized protein n=1 Tax=Hirundo rustica rustica TaxID=333673 RepID=A0A3M0JXS9_HIRRU|nr:hypothetical protein DUI87_18141 [Hirundo rustica rustica]
MVWELLAEHKRLPFPILELDKGVYSVLHAGGPGDAGVSLLAQSCCLPDKPGEEDKGNQRVSRYVRAVLCMKVCSYVINTYLKGLFSFALIIKLKNSSGVQLLGNDCRDWTFKDHALVELETMGDKGQLDLMFYKVFYLVGTLLIGQNPEQALLAYLAGEDGVKRTFGKYQEAREDAFDSLHEIFIKSILKLLLQCKTSSINCAED